MDCWKLSRLRSRSLAFVVGSSCIALGACSVFEPNLLPPEGEGCAGTVPPARIAGLDSPGDETYVVVLRDILIDQGGEEGADPALAPWRRIGFNLDGFCTTQDDLRSECSPRADGLPIQIDGDGGIDNTFGNSFFPVLSLAAAGIDADLIATQERGVGAILLLIDDWNGERNDSQVTVTVTQTVLGTPGTTGGAAPDVTIIGSEAFLDAAGTMPAPLPNWDGNDYFWGREDTFIASNVTTPNIRVTGYVTGGVLVARLPDRTPIKLVGTTVGVEVVMTDLLATGNVYEMFFDPQETPPAVVVAGRWGYNDMVAQAPNVGVCIGSLLYPTLQRILGTMVDVFLDPRNQTDSSLPCDALSVAVTFSGYTGHFGGLAEGQDIPSPCPAP